jgi:VWFA-related protein
MNRFQFIRVAGLFLSLSSLAAHAQDNAQNKDQPSPGTQLPTVTTRSNLVLVPALVKTKAGRVVFSLSADDFILTDNGVRQAVRVEPDIDAQPLAMVVVVETGGQGGSHLDDYRDLGAVLDAVIGGAPHRVAVVRFDGKPHLEQDFTPDTDVAASAMAGLHSGDQGAAILDALKFGIDLLRDQPPAYRRAIMLLSETVDRGSQTSLEDAVRAVEDTNTSIYSFSFSTTGAAVKHEARKLPAPGGTDYSKEPYGPGGCMSRAPNADPDAHGDRAVQALDCAGDLLPPLRLARIAFIAAKDGLRRNVPKSVAELTGGEYFPFKDAKSLAQDLIVISNDVPNYYVLSFRPQSPHAGIHALELKVKDRRDHEVKARKGYWVDAGPGR